MTATSEARPPSRLENDKLLDETNQRILRELAEDPRQSMSALGRRIGMSAPAVTERVQRLERTGVIRGYRLDIDPGALGYPIAAWVRVRPALGHGKIAEQIAARQPEVVECHKITGEDCLLMRVQVRDVADLDRVLEGWQEHASTVTSVIKSTPVEPRNMLPLA
ncbi:Lrp/AsnC family transcriptional regulator [Actinomycetospora chlora]|uniref:Lrp/AsnC family transcriptional regulator n=1 Tax=Actinomycetospora chlora TaxID=663608 RepID=A0ABP9B9X1_9PSEU